MNSLRTFVLATAVAGTLDILSAFVFAGLAGVGPMVVLQGVASGPFGDQMAKGGFGAALIGLCVHFALMANMVAVFLAAARLRPSILRHPALVGLAYGLLLYLVMYCVILPIRYPGVFPQTHALKIAKALFSHLVCVGLPIALIAAKRAGAELPERTDPVRPEFGA